MTALLLVGGLLVLVAGGDLLVRGASRLALSLGISPLVVGLTVVALGTSSPEMAVSIQAALAGRVDLALGNVVGSNIFNVLFILGLSALVTPLLVARQVIRQEVPIMIGASLLLCGFALDRGISRMEGGLFAALLIGYVVFLIRQSRRETKALEGDRTQDLPALAPGSGGGRLTLSVGFVVVGLVLLVVGSRWLVEGAITVAQALGIPEVMIGLTLVAAGTSLPEVAASVIAAWRGQRDIAVGNVVGSNTFNILGVLGFSALVAPAPLAVPASLLSFDLPVMLAVAVACLPVFFTGHTIARWEGAVFLGYYFAYITYLVLLSQRHDALAMFTLPMRWFVLPLTTLTLGVLVGRAWRRQRQTSA